MNRFLLSIVAFLLTAAASFAQEPIYKVTAPIEVKQELQRTDPSIEGLQWNRWTSKNFEVLCLNDAQAQYLHTHLESVKAWTYSRWGLYDIDFSAGCRIICVDDPALFQKMFNLTDTKVEVRRGTDGKITMNVIFMLIKDKPSQIIPAPIARVCFSEFAQAYGSNFGWWAYRGTALLNGPVETIRANLAELKTSLDGNSPMYFSKSLLTMTEEQYRRETPEKQKLFDQNAVAFCLLVRKEFGQDKFHWMLKSTANNADAEAALKQVLGFRDGNHFDQTFMRYMKELSADCASGKTPASYLTITEKVKD